MGILSGVGIPRLDRTTAYQIVNNWTNVRGNHQFRWGADIRRNRFDFIAVNASTRGNFTFAPSVTSAAEAPGSGLGMATFLLGMPSGFDRAVLRGFTSELMWRAAFYFQDVWRVTPKLTINYGLRYDYIGPDTARQPGGIVNFDLNSGNLLLASLGDVSKTANVESDLNNFAPRVGLAYKLTSKTVIRSGFGRSFFISNYGGGFYFLTSTYPIATQQTLSQANIRSAVFPIENGPPAAALPVFPASGSLKAPPGQLLKSRPYDNKASTSIHGTSASNISSVTICVFPAPTSAMWAGSCGVHSTSTLRSPVLDRCFSGGPTMPPFGLDTTIQNGCNCENSSYHALEAVVEKRFSAGYSLNSAFTWSKAIDARGCSQPRVPSKRPRPVPIRPCRFLGILASVGTAVWPGDEMGFFGLGYSEDRFRRVEVQRRQHVPVRLPVHAGAQQQRDPERRFHAAAGHHGDYHVSDPDRAAGTIPVRLPRPQCCRSRQCRNEYYPGSASRHDGLGLRQGFRGPRNLAAAVPMGEL